jgi:hypothetical protein
MSPPSDDKPPHGASHNGEHGNNNRMLVMLVIFTVRPRPYGSAMKVSKVSGYLIPVVSVGCRASVYVARPAGLTSPFHVQVS